MKKTLLFLLLFVISLFAVSQTQTVPNDLDVKNDLTVDSIAIINILEVDSTATLPDSTHIGGKTISKYVFENSKDYTYESSTGLISGGLISINGGDNTLIDLTALKGKIIDSTTDPDNPTDTLVSKDAVTGYNLTTTATPGDVVAIFLSINSNGDIIERLVLFTPEERRDEIGLGLVARNDADEIVLVVNTPINVIHNPNSSLQDFFESWGAFTVDGNKVSPYSTDLRIEKAVGNVFRNGVNFRSNNKNPHNKICSAQAPIDPFNYKLSDGTDVTLSATQIDPNNYDDGSSTIASVPVGKFTVQRISIFAQGIVEILYGQRLFNLMSEAKAALPTIDFTIPADSKAAIPLAFLIVKQGATDLSDAVQAEFFQLRSKGEIGGIGFQNINSAGMVFDPGYTDHKNGTITINDGIVNLYQTTDFSGDLKQYSLSGIGPVTFTNNETNYIVADYTSGSPIFKNTLDVLEINESDVVPVYTVYRATDSLHILSWGTVGSGLVNKLHARLVKTDRFGHESGLSLGETDTRYITTTSGVIWMGGSRIVLPATNSSIDHTEFWYHVGGAWTKSDTNQYNNTQYDDGTDLQTLGVGRYGVNWVYQGIESDSHLYYVLGAGNYTLIEAQSSQVPAIPKVISSHAILVGRIIVVRDAATATQIDSQFEEEFTATPTTNHNNLSNLDGGEAGYYGHHTDDELNIYHPYLNTENTYTENQIIDDTLKVNKGIIPPKYTSTERDAISNPQTGLTIYNTTTNNIQSYDGSNWTRTERDKIYGYNMVSNAATYNTVVCTATDGTILNGLIYCTAYDGTVGPEAAIITFNLPPNYADGTDLDVELHWTSSSTTGNVYWGIGVLAVGADEDMNGTEVYQTGTDAAPGTAYYKQVYSATFTGTNYEADDVVSVVIYRDPDNGGDTMTVDALVSIVVLKYETN